MQKYSNVEFLDPLITNMTKDDQRHRCTARGAEQIWHNIVETRISFVDMTWRLRPRKEDWLDAVIGEGVSLVGCTLEIGKNLLGWMTDISG